MRTSVAQHEVWLEVWLDVRPVVGNAVSVRFVDAVSISCPPSRAKFFELLQTREYKMNAILGSVAYNFRSGAHDHSAAVSNSVSPGCS